MPLRAWPGTPHSMRKVPLSGAVKRMTSLAPCGSPSTTLLVYARGMAGSPPELATGPVPLADLGAVRRAVVLLEVPDVGAAGRDRQRRPAVGEPVELEGAGDETEGHRLGGRIVLDEAGIRGGGCRSWRPGRPAPVEQESAGAAAFGSWCAPRNPPRVGWGAACSGWRAPRRRPAPGVRGEQPARASDAASARPRQDSSRCPHHAASLEGPRAARMKPRSPADRSIAGVRLRSTRVYPSEGIAATFPPRNQPRHRENS